MLSITIYIILHQTFVGLSNQEEFYEQSM